MKKLFISVLVMLVINFSATAQTRFGIKGGFNVANLSIGGSATSGTTTSPIIGFNVGGFTEITIAGGFYFQSGVFVSTKGAKAKQSVTILGQTISSESTITPTYVEIPFNLGCAIGFGENTKFHVLAGPYVAFGVGGKVKDANGKTENIKWGSEKATLTNNGGSDLKSLDLGFNIGAGIEHNNLLFGLQYGLGLSNISPQDNTTIKNNVFGISVGYVFGGKSE